MSEDPPKRIDQSVIDDLRREHSLVAMVARRVKLRRSGRGWIGLCPFHPEKTASFTVTDEKGFAHCFGCGWHGDIFKWVEDTEGVSFREAVLSLADGVLPDARHPLPQTAHRERAAVAVDVVASSTAGRWIFSTAGPARGEIVERYLESRGLDPRAAFLPGVSGPLESLRFHPRCPVSVWRVHQHPEEARLTAPAMVVPIMDAEGAVWGVEVTWLAPDGRSEANLPLAQGKKRPKRKIFGKVGGYAAFLTPPESMCGEAPLVVGEGFETTWSFAQSFGQPCRVVAALGLHNLQGGAVTLRDGSLPLWSPRADPDKPPFLIADAGDVVIAVDADMKPLLRQKVQLARGAKPVVADISGLQRVELCASLASQAWRRAGASKVTAVRPRLGMDFNDQLRRVA